MARPAGPAGARHVNYYERHIGDYLKDTAHLSLLEHGIYTRLLDVYYTRECPIPKAEVSRLRKRAKAPSSAGKLPPCPHQDAIVDLYHEVLPELPGLQLLPNGRKRAIGKTWQWVLTSKKPDHTPRDHDAEEALAWFRKYFELARDNDFLMGRTPRTGDHATWKCDLDFLLTDNGMKHVIEKTEPRTES
jgi:hypothetical protein